MGWIRGGEKAAKGSGNGDALFIVEGKGLTSRAA